MNSKKIMVGLVVTVLVVIVWACTGIQGRTQNNPGQLDSADGLTAALSAKAMAVDLAGTVSQPFFEPEGQAIRVDAEEVSGSQFAGDNGSWSAGILACAAKECVRCPLREPALTHRSN